MTTLYLLDEVGPYGTTAASFLSELRAINTPALTLRVSSPGGDVWDALAMANGLRDHPAEVTVVVDGLAASAASVITMAGDTIRMNRASMMMIHEASGLTLGSAEDMRQMADLLNRASDTIAGIYQARAGGTVESWRAAMKAETWYSGQEAVDAGLADEAVGERAVDDWDALVENLTKGNSEGWAAMTQGLRDSIGGEPFLGFSAGKKWTDAAAFGEHVAAGQLWSPDAAHTRGRRTPPAKGVPARQRTTRARAEALLMHADQLITPRQEN